MGRANVEKSPENNVKRQFNRLLGISVEADTFTSFLASRYNEVAQIGRECVLLRHTFKKCIDLCSQFKLLVNDYLL